MTDREKFETWAVDNKLSLAQGLYGGYAFADTSSAWKAWRAALASQQPADDDWIDWVGGECPVARTAVVEVKFIDGYKNEYDACVLGWGRNNNNADIIAYRVVRP